VLLWDVATGQKIRVIHNKSCGEKTIGNAMFLPDGLYIVEGIKAEVRMWRVNMQVSG
jgi:hypothetical protein